MFSQIIDQKKNNWYKFEPATWCYKHHSTVQGPMPLKTVTLPPAPLPQPNLPGLPPLPSPPEPEQSSEIATMPPLVTKYTLTAYCDDLKPVITNIYEFHLVERVMTIFELSSGCKMHRDPASQKCKFLPLSKWKSLPQARGFNRQFFPQKF